MTHCPLWCKGECALQKEQIFQKRIELWALWSCCDEPVSLFQEELDLKEMPPQMYSPDWKLKDQLFLTHLFPELTQVNLQITAMM